MITIAICGTFSEIESVENIVNDYMQQQGVAANTHYFMSGSAALDMDKNYDIVVLFISSVQDIFAGKVIGRKDSNVKIICISNYSQYMEYAINEMHAFAFMEKPVSEKRLKAQLEDILYIIQHDAVPTVRFKILDIEKDYKIGSRYMDFVVKDIYYFEYTNRKVCLRTGKKSYFFYGTMNKLRDIMLPYDFYSCHQSYLVNMQYVIDIKGYNICLCNEEMIPLAQKRSVDFRKKYSGFLRSY